ncbi:hypothetical protein IW262DRAFT_1302748 [Armillaria fumosa]|nr:hypothetical protein IW262DRAFT_1302748 [Armillaria fumosa]
MTVNLTKVRGAEDLWMLERYGREGGRGRKGNIWRMRMTVKNTSTFGSKRCFAGDRSVSVFLGRKHGETAMQRYKDAPVAAKYEPGDLGTFRCSYKGKLPNSSLQIALATGVFGERTTRFEWETNYSTSIERLEGAKKVCNERVNVILRPQDWEHPSKNRVKPASGMEKRDVKQWAEEPVVGAPGERQSAVKGTRNWASSVRGGPLEWRRHHQTGGTTIPSNVLEKRASVSVLVRRRAYHQARVVVKTASERREVPYRTTLRNNSNIAAQPSARKESIRTIDRDYFKLVNSYMRHLLRIRSLVVAKENHL